MAGNSSVAVAAELVRRRGRGMLIRGADGPLMVYRSGMGTPVLPFLAAHAAR